MLTSTGTVTNIIRKPADKVYLLAIASRFINKHAEQESHHNQHKNNNANGKPSGQVIKQFAKYIHYTHL